MKTRNITLALALCFANAAHAQDAALNLTFGVKAWQAQWTTWGSDISASDGFDVVTQVPAKDKVAMIPVIGLQYGRLVASLSAVAPTGFEFRRANDTNIHQKRSELDATVGYYLTPRLSLGVGYKRFTQKGSTFTYEVAGPSVVGGVTAPLRGPWSMYGNAAFGSLSASGKSTIRVNADYRLTELGAVYSIPMSQFLRAISITGGYRIQVVNALKLPIYDQNGAFSYFQDGRDLTQGFTLGLVASF